MTEKIKMISFIERVAIKKLGESDKWRMRSLEFIGDTNDWLVKGGKPRKLKSGPRRGKNTWRDSAIRSVCVTEQEEIQERLLYEMETGNCSKCQGTKRMYTGYNATDGNTYAPCNRCNATGIAPENK